MVPLAGILPAELTALRGVGLAIALILIVYAIARRRTLRNADVLLLLISGIALAIVTGTEVVNGLLSAFSFEKGNGGRILGLAVFAIFILFMVTLRALSVGARNSRQLSAALEGLAWEEFRQAGLPDRFKGKVAILIPAYNEEERLPRTLERIVEYYSAQSYPWDVIVVSDGSKDRTGEIVRNAGDPRVRLIEYQPNHGKGYAVRTGMLAAEGDLQDRHEQLDEELLAACAAHDPDRADDALRAHLESAGEFYAVELKGRPIFAF